MRRQISLLACIILMSRLGFAQIEIGLKTGINGSKPDANGFADTTTSNPIVIQSGSGAQFGLFLTWPLSSKFSFQSEVLYSSLNAQAKTNISFADLNVKVKTQYVQVPLSIKYSHREFHKIKPYVTFGANIGYITQGTADVKVNVPLLPALNSVQRINMADSNWQDTKRFDLGAMFVVGASYPLGPGNIGLDFRYVYGLTDIDKTSTKYHNQFWMLNLGYSISISKKN